MSPRINLNDFVWVKLTEAGEKTFTRFFTATKKSLERNSSGWCRFQFWELLKIFGPTHNIHTDPQFVDNTVYLTEPS
jgi:hypothetical protein